MSPDQTQDGGAYLFGEVPTTTTRDNKSQHEPVLRCDEPEGNVLDEENLFGCPCCINPWFR